MALYVKNVVVERLVRDLMAVTGESIVEAVATSCRERLARLDGTADTAARVQALHDLQARVANGTPVVDVATDARP